MTQRDSLSSGDDPDYQAFIGEQRRARRLLARIDLNEDFAREWEHFPAIYPDPVGQELVAGRQRFANTYRRLIGVMPNQRESLRRDLEEVMRTGNGTVDAAISAARSSTAKLIGENAPHDPFA